MTKSHWRSRTVHAYVSTEEEAEKFGMQYSRCWIVRMPGGWYRLASVTPIHLQGYEETDRYADINEAIRLECTPALIHIIEGQAEALRQQGELLDRCLYSLRESASDEVTDTRLVPDLVRNLTEVPDGHEDAIR
jgi:hypothetical protein